MREQVADRRRAIAMIRCAICLKAVDADFVRHVKVPTGIGPEWLDMAVVALRLPTEQLVSARGRGWIEASCGRLRRRNRELVELKCLELRRNLVSIRRDMWQIAKAKVCGNR